jgi:hypothetical protein
MVIAYASNVTTIGQSEAQSQRFIMHYEVSIPDSICDLGVIRLCRDSFAYVYGYTLYELKDVLGKIKTNNCFANVNVKKIQKWNDLTRFDLSLGEVQEIFLKTFPMNLWMIHGLKLRLHQHLVINMMHYYG